MRGKWKSTVSGRDGTSTVELVKQDSDDKAQVRVTITDAISYVAVGVTSAPPIRSRTEVAILG
jgi:hypothetical protein